MQEFLVPSLEEQGAEEIEIWNDSDGKGNLISCMESFAARKGDGGTWHIQDDAIVCRDFVKRCRELDNGLAYGFCCQHFEDDPGQAGRVHMEDAWTSFLCVRIPDEWARECADWFFREGRDDPELKWMSKEGKYDDTFFLHYLIKYRGREMVTNVKPNLVDHVDMLIGGSCVSSWRGYWARAEWFEDQDLVDELEQKIRRRASS